MNLIDDLSILFFPDCLKSKPTSKETQIKWTI